MVELKESGWSSKLLPILRLVTEGGLVLVLKNLMDAWELIDQLRDQIGYHGMYEILDYNSTLDIRDVKGEEARITRRETIRFLQDNVVAIYDHVWGDGGLFVEYICQPGIPVDFVDFHEDGSTLAQSAAHFPTSVRCSSHQLSTGRPNLGRMSAAKGP